MTYEIRLQVGSPNVLRNHLRKAADSYELGTDTRHTLDDAVAQIDAQLKPTVEEPTEWGSVVRARRVGYGTEDTTRLRWQRLHTRDANDSWVSEPAGDLGVRYSSHWSYLIDPEVLRVGVGGAS